MIANVFVGSDNYYYTPQYDPYYYGSAYDQAYYSYDNYDPGYNYGYFAPQYDYSYSPDYFGGYPSYSYESFGGYPSDYDYDPYVDAGDFPLAYFTSSVGSVYVSQVYSDLLAYGYDEGYNDGLYAREHRRSRDYYDDPFIVEDTVYDPYSYSLGANRRCLSQGYKLGYSDALQGNDEYDPNYDDNNVDLVSMVIGGELQVN